MTEQSKKVRTYFISLLLTFVFVGCGEDPIRNIEHDCAVITEDPATCLAADSIDFGPVTVGDTALTQFIVSNWNNGPGVSSFWVSIMESSSSQFEWESGRFLLKPLGEEYIGVIFLPDTIGPFSGTIEINPGSCRSVHLAGTGTLVQRPPLLKVTNNSQYAARFTVSYTWNDSIYVERKELSPFQLFKPGNVDHVDLPVDATGIDIHTEVASGSDPDPWTTVFRRNFLTPVLKCYRLNYDGYGPAWTVYNCPYYPSCITVTTAGP